MSAHTPEACEQLFAHYLNAGNVDNLLALYEPQASHVRSDGSVAHGKDAIRLVLDEFVAMQPTLHVRLKKTVGAGDDLAVLYDDWTLTAKGADAKLIEMNGKGCHVIRMQHDGTWMFVLTGVTNATF